MLLFRSPTDIDLVGLEFMWDRQGLEILHVERCAERRRTLEQIATRDPASMSTDVGAGRLRFIIKETGENPDEWIIGPSFWLFGQLHTIHRKTPRT